MATVQSVITSARYDLQDYQKGMRYDDAELLDHMNRMVGVMDSTLASLNSDLVEAYDATLSTTADQNYVDLSALNSDLWDSLRAVWISSDELTHCGIDLIRYKRQFNSGSAQPKYWALSNRYLMFEQDADDAYTLEITYNKKTAALALTDSMPYSDVFNEIFRELLVMHARAKKDGQLANVDRYYNDIFKSRAMQENLRRNFVIKPYVKDF